MSSKKKLKIVEYLKKRNVKRFSIFMAIAFIFLILSKLSNDYKQTIKLKIVLANIEDEIILQNDSVNTIDALIEAKGFALVPFIFKKYKPVVVDAKTDIIIKPRTYIFDVQKHKFLIEDQLGTSYKLLSIKPDTLIMKYSKRASRYVPVVLETKVDYAAGYDIFGDFEMSIDSVKIIGTDEKVSSIKSITSETLVLNEVNSDIDKSVNLDLIKGLEIIPKSINVTAETKRFTEGTIEVPLTIINKPENLAINYFPKVVKISYYVDLDNYKSIRASDFDVQCNFENLQNDQSFLVPKVVKQPKFVKRVSMKQKRIDFIKL